MRTRSGVIRTGITTTMAGTIMRAIGIMAITRKIADEEMIVNTAVKGAAETVTETAMVMETDMATGTTTRAAG